MPCLIKDHLLEHEPKAVLERTGLLLLGSVITPGCNIACSLDASSQLPRAQTSVALRPDKKARPGAKPSIAPPPIKAKPSAAPRVVAGRSACSAQPVAA